MKKAIICDIETNGHVELPEGDFELSLGRASSNDIPVPIHSDRGDKKLGQILGSMDPGFGNYLEKLCRTVSAENHAILTREFGDVYIEDKGSTAGTNIKKQGGAGEEYKLASNKRYRVSDSDIICLGDYKLQFTEFGEFDPRLFSLGKQNKYSIKPRGK
jgi:pSer/pThr/pTyr-binding forkhead associated (FHA) protein